MAVLASDDFTRADNADLGANWTALSGQDPFKIVANEAVPTNTGVDAAETYDGGVTWPDDQYSQVTTFSTGAGGVGTGPGVVLRGAGTAFYRIVADPFLSGDVEVVKFNPGSTVLGSAIAATWVTGDVMKVEMSGSTITVYQNDVSIGTRTDSAITSGKPGIGYSSFCTTPRVDNWSGGDLGAAAGLPATFDPIPFMSNLRI